MSVFAPRASGPVIEGRVDSQSSTRVDFPRPVFAATRQSDRGRLVSDNVIIRRTASILLDGDDARQVRFHSIQQVMLMCYGPACPEIDDDFGRNSSSLVLLC